MTWYHPIRRIALLGRGQPADVAIFRILIRVAIRVVLIEIKVLVLKDVSFQARVAFNCSQTALLRSKRSLLQIVLEIIIDIFGSVLGLGLYSISVSGILPWIRSRLLSLPFSVSFQHKEVTLITMVIGVIFLFLFNGKHTRRLSVNYLNRVSIQNGVWMRSVWLERRSTRGGCSSIDDNGWRIGVTVPQVSLEMMPLGASWLVPLDWGIAARKDFKSDQVSVKNIRLNLKTNVCFLIHISAYLFWFDFKNKVNFKK